MSQKSKKRRAVALKYPQGVEAPLIIAKGEGRIAEQIINEAEKNNIYIEEDSALVDLLGLSEVGSLVPEAAEYLQYMRNLLPQEGLLAGLTALLQCSWAYAYIGQNVCAKYREELSRSPYKSWFDAYTCPEYIEANQKWIDLLDKETADIPSNLAEKLRLIFRKCAEYENRFWDVM